MWSACYKSTQYNVSTPPHFRSSSSGAHAAYEWVERGAVILHDNRSSFVMLEVLASFGDIHWG